MQDFHKLKVWEKSHEITLAIYRLTGQFPKEELYGLTSQMRRSASSIPTNIAEGCGRGGEGELGHFIQIALGSACELEYQVLLSRDLQYLSTTDEEILTDSIREIKQMLAALRKRVVS